MEYKKADNERVSNEREIEEECINTYLFTAAGTALTVAFLKRIVGILTLIQQWRAIVFLVLNLVLLTILFISIRSRSSDDDQASKVDDSIVEDKKIIIEVNEKQEKGKQFVGCSDYHVKACNKSQIEVVDSQRVDFETSACNKLTKDELNERVEAFIAMFRQHLVSDAIRGSRNQFDSRPRRSI